MILIWLATPRLALAWSTALQVVGLLKRQQGVFLPKIVATFIWHVGLAPRTPGESAAFVVVTTARF